MSTGFTFAAPPPCRARRKALTRHGSFAPERILLIYRAVKSRVTQPLPQRVIVKSILDRSFRYTRSIDTDLRKTFARIRREQRLQAQGEGRGGAKIVRIGEHKQAVVS
jgi:hypothetical protein